MIIHSFYVLLISCFACRHLDKGLIKAESARYLYLVLQKIHKNETKFRLFFVMLGQIWTLSLVEGQSKIERRGKRKGV